MRFSTLRWMQSSAAASSGYSAVWDKHAAAVRGRRTGDEGRGDVDARHARQTDGQTDRRFISRQALAARRRSTLLQTFWGTLLVQRRAKE